MRQVRQAKRDSARLAMKQTRKELKIRAVTGDTKCCSLLACVCPERALPSPTFPECLAGCRLRGSSLLSHDLSDSWEHFISCQQSGRPVSFRSCVLCA
ncbi:hypothetical protein XELAEV_18029668mg [Xenopus laevis]|uniref:Uncharacterized protein n=1 Tax=Xenopus laevis TaxID=8355 RepID=A0A974CU99_XENLA|nr:hypothetical protein XELAEV_18029668mg [Xenopus laevis]